MYLRCDDVVVPRRENRSQPSLTLHLLIDIGERESTPNLFSVFTFMNAFQTCNEKREMPNWERTLVQEAPRFQMEKESLCDKT
jgi:hypothetical protein